MGPNSFARLHTFSCDTAAVMTLARPREPEMSRRESYVKRHGVSLDLAKPCVECAPTEGRSRPCRAGQGAAAATNPLVSRRGKTASAPAVSLPRTS